MRPIVEASWRVARLATSAQGLSFDPLTFDPPIQECAYEDVDAVPPDSRVRWSPVRAL
jgi:hypothetical protein